jgi:hypothetical protein
MMKKIFCLLICMSFLLSHDLSTASTSDSRFFGTYCGDAPVEHCVTVKVKFLGITVDTRTVCKTVNIEDIKVKLNYRDTVKGGIVNGAGGAMVKGDEMAFVIAGVVVRHGKMKGSATVAGMDPQRGVAYLSGDGLALTIHAYGKIITIRKDQCGNDPPQVDITHFPSTPISYGQVHFFRGEVSDAEDLPLPTSEFEPDRLVWTYDEGGLLVKSPSGLRASTRLHHWIPLIPQNPDSSSISDFVLPVLEATEHFLPRYLPPGEHVITFSATDSGGLSATDSVNITVVNTPPHTPTIFMPANGSTLTAGCETDFLGQAYDLEDGFISGTGLVWSSNVDGLLGSGTEMRTSLAAPGTHLLRLTATDSVAGSSFTENSISVQPSIAGCGPIARIVSPPYQEWKGAMAIVNGTRVTFVGTAEDSEDPSDTLLLQWKRKPISPAGPEETLGTGSVVNDVEFTAVGADRRYEITFTATDTDGNTARDKMTILVLSSPIL